MEDPRRAGLPRLIGVHTVVTLHVPRMPDLELHAVMVSLVIFCCFVIFLCVGALSVCMSVHYMRTWYLRRPDESFGSLNQL